MCVINNNQYVHVPGNLMFSLKIMLISKIFKNSTRFMESKKIDGLEMYLKGKPTFLMIK